MIDIHKYTIPLTGIDLNIILKSWTWMSGEDKTIVALTKMGDALLKDPSGQLYFLDTGIGEMKFIGESYTDFEEGTLDGEILEEILLPGLVDELENSGKVLEINQVYAFYKLPLLGGTYDKDNIYRVDLYEHYNLSGEMHFQLKDLPDGTPVKIEIVNKK